MSFAVRFGTFSVNFSNSATDRPQPGMQKEEDTTTQSILDIRENIKMPIFSIFYLVLI